MAQLLGTGGYIQDDANPEEPVDYNVSEWTLNGENDKQEVSDVSSNWKQWIAGLNGANGSFKIFWGAGTAVNFLTTFPIGGTKSLTLLIGTTGDSVSFTCIIDGYALPNSAKSPIEFSPTFTVNGPITINTGS